MTNADERRRRPAITVVVKSLHDQESDDVSEYLTASERIELVWTLSRRAWSLGDHGEPSDRGGEIPVRVIERP